MKRSSLKSIFMALSIASLFHLGCKQAVTESNTTSPTLTQIDSVQKSNVAGNLIKNDDSLWKAVSAYKVVGFGHYHDKISNYRVFQRYLPKLRECGFTVLALELPASIQPLLDSIMDERTDAVETNKLLEELNRYLVSGDNFINVSSNERHYLYEIILTWLNAGGIVIACDVPYIFNENSRSNDYHLEVMYKTISAQSKLLLDAVGNLNINDLDDEKDIVRIARVRSAYMSALFDYYSSKSVKIVCFLGVKHLLLANENPNGIGVSVVPISKKYFKRRIFSFYPIVTYQDRGFYEGHKWIGDVAFSVKSD